MEHQLEKTLPLLFKSVAENNPEIPCQFSRNSEGDFDSISYKDAFQKSLNFGAGLLASGVKRNDNIGLISDNRAEWFQADMGLMAIGCRDVPRGNDATAGDLTYILSFAGCKITIAENAAQVKKILSIKKELPELRRLIMFEKLTDELVMAAVEAGVQLECFADIVSKGADWREKNPGAVEKEMEAGQWDDLAAIIFTSGTTGTPKGVMLSHGNFITQLDELQERIYLNRGDRALLVLPVWHVFERLCEYVILCQAASLCYSKPIASLLLNDFNKLNPQLIPAVPRVYEAIYNGIYRKMRKTGGITLFMFNFFVGVAKAQCALDRKMFRKSARFRNDFVWLYWIFLAIPWVLLMPLKALGNALVFKKIRAMLGNNFRAGVSGGGAFPPVLDSFFWAVGVNIVEGYGLTETAPVISVRPIKKPVFGTVGSPIRGVNVRIVDDNGNDLGKCKKGIVQVKGGTVMKGYYNRQDLTDKVMKDGWFDTGDIGILTLNNEIKLLGRQKDTIVLRGGENVEPLPIEMRISESRYVNTAVVVGNDQRFLCALILPSKDDVISFANENNIDSSNYEELLENEQIHHLFESIISEAISSRNGFKMFEHISKFTFITKEFEVGVELSAKQEMKRFVVNEMYKKEIAAMYKD